MEERLRDFVPAAAIEKFLTSESPTQRLPGVVFRSADFLRLEFRRWLSRTWLFVGRAADLPNPGDANTAPGLPLFLVRGEDGRVRAFHNACRHRGHRIVTKPRSKAREFVCPYHCWAYDLCGRLLRTPHAGGFNQHSIAGFAKEDHGLVPVRCGTWHDWIFVNLDGEAEPLEDFVKPMADKLDFVDFGRLQHFLTMTRRPVPANWKICMENTMEPYHVPFVHAKTAAGQPLGLHYMVVDDPIVGSAIDIEGSAYSNQPGAPEINNLDMSARYLLRMPNFFLTSYAPDVIVDSMLVPDYSDPKTCWLEQAWYTTSGRAMSSQEIADWQVLEEAVIAEDIGVMSEVQAGIESPVVDDGGVLTEAWERCLAGFYRHMVRQLAD